MPELGRKKFDAMLNRQDMPSTTIVHASTADSTSGETTVWFLDSPVNTYVHPSTVISHMINSGARGDILYAGRLVKQSDDTFGVSAFSPQSRIDNSHDQTAKEAAISRIQELAGPETLIVDLKQ